MNQKIVSSFFVATALVVSGCSWFGSSKDPAKYKEMSETNLENFVKNCKQYNLTSKECELAKAEKDSRDKNKKSESSDDSKKTLESKEDSK